MRPGDLYATPLNAPVFNTFLAAIAGATSVPDHMKLAMVTEFSVPHYAGGGERRYFELSKRLAGRGHDVTWVSMRQGTCPDTEISDGVKMRHIGPRIQQLPYRTAGQFLHYQVALLRYFSTHRYDLIDVQPFSPLLACFVASKLMKMPMVASIYDVAGADEDQWLDSGRIGRIAEKVLYRLPYSTMVTISDSARDALHTNYGIPRSRLQLVYCGADIATIDSIAPAAGKPTDVIFVGRLAPNKHVDDFVDVVARLKQTIPAISAIIIGHGPMEPTLRKLIDAKDLRVAIKVLGKLERHDDVIAEIRKSRLLILPSTREGFGIVLAEAGACGIPVLAYRCPGVIDVVEDGVSGFIVPPRDVGRLATAALQLLQNDKLRHTMGVAGRRRVERRFSWDAAAVALEHVYLSMTVTNDG